MIALDQRLTDLEAKFDEMDAQLQSLQYDMKAITTDFDCITGSLALSKINVGSFKIEAQHLSTESGLQMKPLPSRYQQLQPEDRMTIASLGQPNGPKDGWKSFVIGR